MKKNSKSEKRLGRFPNKVKIGRVIWDIDWDAEDLVSRGVYGEMLSYPPTLKINLNMNPTPGETLLHEVIHAVEANLGFDYFHNNDGGMHVAFISHLYSVLRENGFLASTIYCNDFIENEKS